MEYQPIKTEEKKQEWIEFLKNLKGDINGREEDKNVKTLAPRYEYGDVALVKDLAGNLLATLTDETVTID